MDKFCRRAGHTFIHTRTVTSRRCTYCGTIRWPWSEQDPSQMTRRDLLEENGLLAATEQERLNPTAPVALPLNLHTVVDAAGTDPAGHDHAEPDSIREDESGAGEPIDDAIDDWLRFRPAGASGD